MASSTKDKQHINVWTLGHIGHGKTTLTAAITKVLAGEGRAKAITYKEIDNAPRKEGVLDIRMAHVEYETAKRRYLQVDCPGHADYMKRLITEAAQIDIGILVVSALDGVMPQTKEHVLLASQAGMQALVCFLNKVDAFDDPDESNPETLDLVEMEIRELVDRNGFSEDIPVIRGSAKSALKGTKNELGREAILKLMDALDGYVRRPAPPLAPEVPYQKFEGRIYVLKKEEGGRHTPFFRNYKPQFSMGSTTVKVTMRLQEGTEMVMPGDDLTATFELESRVPLARGARFDLKEEDRTIAKGVVLAVIS